MTTTTDHDAATAPRGLALACLLCGPFMSMVDSSAVNIAVPEIVATTGANASLGGWVVSAYLLGIAVALPLTTGLARVAGVRRLYVASLAMFGVASLACALAPGIGTLIAARAVQGIMSAPLVPLALSLLFGGPDRERGSPVAGLLLFLAPALGPTLGALVMTAWGWPAIFLLNLPVVLFGLLAARSLPFDVAGSRSIGIDLVALLLLVSGAVSATLAASMLGGGMGASAMPGALLLMLGLLLLLGWAARLRARRGTDLAPYILASRAHRASVVVAAAASVVLFGMVFLVPIHFSDRAGWSLLITGLVLLPQGVAMGLSHPLGSHLERKLGLRRTVLLGLSLLAASSLLLLAVDDSTPPWLVAVGLVIRGVAMGTTVQPMIVALMRAVPIAEAAGVSTLFTISQRLGGSVGIALIAAFYHAREPGLAFHDTAVLLTLVAVVAIVPACFLPPRTNDRARHRAGFAQAP